MKRRLKGILPRFPELMCSITTKIQGLDNDVSSAKHCITCLNAFLQRLYPLDKLEWLEQTLVTRVYLTGKYPPTQTPEAIKDLRRVFDGTPINLRMHLSW